MSVTQLKSRSGCVEGAGKEGDNLSRCVVDFPSSHLQVLSPENPSGPRPTLVAGLPAEATKGPPACKVSLLFTVSPGLLHQDVPGESPSNHSRSLKTRRMKSGAGCSAWLWGCFDIRYYPSEGLTKGGGMFGISLAFLWLAPK